MLKGELHFKRSNREYYQHTLQATKMKMHSGED